MFERNIEYDAAFVGEFPTVDENAGPALTWAATMAKKHACGSTAVAPSKRHFKDHRILSELPASVSRETPQTLTRFPRTQPVVISFWPTAKDLEQLDGAHGLKALVVVPWLEEDIRTWRSARGAIDILGRLPVPEAPTITDPVVRVALQSVTEMVNLSTGLANSRDKSFAVHAFKILKRNGHLYDADEVRPWAMANGWAADDARELSEYAEGVLGGRAYHVGPSPWKAQIIRMWRKDAGVG